jgi:protein-S-isoprenylcysteine O-methyltransferase Ste14
MLALVYFPLYGPQGSASKPWFAVVGLGITTVGVTLGLAGRVALGRMGTASLTIITEPTLYTKGLYRFIRHPIYSGFALVFLGHQVAFLFMPGLIIWLVFVMSFIYPRIQVEEEMLVEQFGNRYLAYQNSSWSMLPYVY